MGERSGMLGLLIRTWRDQNRYGVRAVAKMIGVSTATMSRIENGEDMNQQTLMLVLRWLIEEPRP